VSDVDESEASQILSWRGIDDRDHAMSRRRLMTHVVLHEIRHLAQLALAARTAGVAPPGEHDLFYFAEFT
jgi:uncharacterized damage-inducible protein DinB